jgi:hypothetical protein
MIQIVVVVMKNLIIIRVNMKTMLYPDVQLGLLLMGVVVALPANVSR